MVDYTDYITQGALARGLDPKTALHVVDTEGGRGGTTGDSGTSFGPFQVHVAGDAPGTTAPGLGNEMLSKGLDPKNPYQSIDYSLDYAASHGGFSPDIWHGLRTGYQEGYGVGEQRHGGTYVGVVHPEDGITPEGAALLSSILQQHYPSEDKSTGNDLLDGIMQGHVFGQAEPQAQPALDTRALQAATPPAQAPETVPELAKPVQTAPLQPMPGYPPIPGTRDNPLLQPGPEGAVVGSRPIPGSLDRNSFWNPNQIAPYNPPGVRDDRQPEARARPIIQPDARVSEASMIPQGLLDTGNALLNKILRARPAITAPRGGASLLGSALPQLLQRLAIPPDALAGTGQQDPTAAAQIPPGADKAATTIKDLIADPALGKLLYDVSGLSTIASGGEQVKRVMEGGQGPTPEEAIGDVMLAAGGSAVGGRGGLGAGPRLPERMEPPPIAEGPRGAPAGSAEVPPRVPGAEVGGTEAGGAAPPPTEPPSGEMPTPASIPPPQGVKAETQALSDDLWQASQVGRADMIEAQKLVDSLPSELKGAADEQAYHERESRMTGKPIPPSATTQRIERLLKPFDDAIHATATWIREHAPDIYGQLQEKPLRTAEEGHVHRKVVGQKLPGEMLDPQRGDVITGLGGGLSRRASGMMHRTPDFVLEDNAGNRMPGRGPLVGQKGGPSRYGETFTDARTGVKYTVKEPTTAELEAKYGNRRYVKSLLANTLDNYLRLSRVRRNIEILEKWKPQLEGAGHWIPEGSQVDRPRNFVRVEVPQLRGWAEPHIAAELNDIYRLSRDDADGLLQKVNKFLIGTMFSLPYRHILNVGAHYAVGRGFDWVYRNPMLARAYTEVATQGPNYMRYLKAGAGLQYPGPLTENFYNTLLGKLFHDQMTSPEWKNIFDMLGHKAADVVKAEYAWSRKALWKYNDVFLTARIMELERAGKPLKEAIRTAEQEIPNYRLPTNSTLLRKLINSSYVAFGRYGYGRANALVHTVRNLVGPNATGEERLRALGQALIMIVGGTEGYKLANAALQTSQQQINQQLGPTWGPRIAGAKPLVVGGIGPFGPLRATAQYIGSMLGLNDDEKGFASVLGSWITPAPAPELAMEAFFNRNTFTGQPVVNPYASPLGRATQFGEAVLGQVNPVQLAIESARKGLLPGIGPQFGFQQEYKGPPGRVQRLLRHQAGRQEARDPIERGIKSLLAR